MPFKVRDLMIDVLPEAAAGGGPNLGCCPGTLITCIQGTCPTYTFTCCPGTRITCFLGTCIVCTFIQQTCVVCTLLQPTCPTPISPCGGTMIPPGQMEGVATPENLATLKAQLQQALAQVEAQERAMDESQKPQTVEETEALEQKLREALEELRQHREELQRRSSEEDR